jgi:hypothetical protein
MDNISSFFSNTELLSRYNDMLLMFLLFCNRRVVISSLSFFVSSVFSNIRAYVTSFVFVMTAAADAAFALVLAASAAMMMRMVMMVAN